MQWLLHRLFIVVAANGLALFAVSRLLSEYFSITSDPLWLGFVYAGTALGLLNIFVRPLLKMLSLPFMLISVGLFTIVINAGILYLLQQLFADILPELQTAIAFDDGSVSNYLIVAAVLGIINSLLNWILK